jgi:hypothetical protein
MRPGARPGWSQRIAGQKIDHRRQDVVIDCQTVADLESSLKALLAKRRGA